MQPNSDGILLNTRKKLPLPTTHHRSDESGLKCSREAPKILTKNRRANVRRAHADSDATPELSTGMCAGLLYVEGPLFPWLQPATSLSAAPLHQNCCSKYFLVDTDAAISTTNLGRPYSFKLFDEQGRQPERAPFHWLACTKLYKWRCSHLLRNACVKKTWGKFFFHPRKFSGKTENTSTKSKRCSPSVSFLTLRSSLL